MPIESTYQDNTTINELIGKAPGWLLRSGISMIAFVTIVLLVTSYFISYPDKISGKGMLTSDTPPIEIVSKTTGYIDTILVKDGAEVLEGTTLLSIHNTTNENELAKFKTWIKEYEIRKDHDGILTLKFPADLQLGMIQNDYANLEIQFSELIRVLKDKFVFQQINNINRETDKINELNQSVYREIVIYEKEVKISRRNYSRNIALKKEGAVSELDVERSETQLLQMERQFESLKNGVIQNNIRIEQLNLEVTKLKKQRKDEIKNLQFTIQEIITRTKTKMEEWSSQYQLKSSLEGTINYNTSIVKNRTIKSGDIIGYVLPDHGMNKYITAHVSTTNFGKLAIGQKVIVKLDAFHHKEFGTLILEVDKLNHVPIKIEKDQFYEIKMLLPEVIKTDYGNEIPFRPMMTCTIEAITEDRNLLSRVFDQLNNLLKKVKEF